MEVEAQAGDGGHKGRNKASQGGGSSILLGPRDSLVGKLTTEIAKITQTESFRKKAEEQGATADYMNPQQLMDHTNSGFVRWAKVVKAANIQAE